MSDRPSDEIEYSFRIVGIPRDDIHVVQKYLQGVQFDIGVYFEDPSKLVVAVPLVENANSEAIFQLVESKEVSEISHGLFVSFTAHQDITGIDFPEFVLQAYRRLGGNIAISLIFSTE